MADQLRLTAFPVAPVATETEAWWQELFGVEPEFQEIRRAEGIQRLEGPLGSNRITLVVRPDRIDWIVTPVANPQLPELPLIGDSSAEFTKFSELMKQWMASSPRIHRLAFGSNLIIKTADQKEAYQLLNRYLPAVELDCEESSDFLYSINRPRSIRLQGLEELKINRLSRWSAIRASILATASQPSVSKLGQTEIFGCRVELDINTDADLEAQLPGDQLCYLLDVLVQYAAEIIEKGDIR